MDWIEIVGYTGSVLVAVSLMMSNVWKLRWINLIGAAFFSAYGLIVKAYPVFGLNLFIVIVDAYYLFQMSNKKEDFSFAEIINKDEDILKQFIERYRSDINRFFPDFKPGSIQNKNVLFILRNLIPVGLFIYEPADEKIVQIEVDYVVPDYRDLKNAQYFFTGGKDYFLNRGFEKFRTYSNVEEHNKYLKKIGFTKEEKNVFEMNIAP